MNHQIFSSFRTPVSSLHLSIYLSIGGDVLSVDASRSPDAVHRRHRDDDDDDVVDDDVGTWNENMVEDGNGQVQRRDDGVWASALRRWMVVVYRR